MRCGKVLNTHYVRLKHSDHAGGMAGYSDREILMDCSARHVQRLVSGEGALATVVDEFTVTVNSFERLEHLCNGILEYFAVVFLVCRLNFQIEKF